MNAVGSLVLAARAPRTGTARGRAAPTPLVLLLLALAGTHAAACGGGGGSGGGDAGPTGDAPPGDAPLPTPPDVDLVVDANRNGSLERTPGLDDEGEAAWTMGSGAIFLANLDDDDGDGDADALDDLVNGDDDALDLARVELGAWPDAPDGATGALGLDAASKDLVNVFRKTGDTWVRLSFGAPVALSTEDLRQGVTFGVEAKDFVRTPTQPWQGEAELTLVVSAAPPEAAELGRDTVVLKVAPWLANHNLRKFDTVYYSTFSSRLTSTLGPVLDKHDVTVSNLPANDFNGTSDIWFEDWMQTGWTSMPAVDGSGDAHGMIVYNARPWGREVGHEPIKLLRQRFLGKDKAVMAFYSEVFETNQGSTYDSHGNHDALPPYEGFPLGRIFTGSGMIASTANFYAAQSLQPHVVADTSWLVVGHIDEVYAPVRSTSARGFKLLENSPRTGVALFDQWVTEGHEGAPVFQGLVDFENINWETTVGGIQGSAVLRSWNQEAQIEIDAMRESIKTQAGLTDDDFVEVPVLYEELDDLKVAYLPDTANVRVIGEGTIAIFPEPHGALIEDQDAFKAALIEILNDPDNQLGGPTGLTVEFGDSFDYHTLLGDIHCASNWSAPPSGAEARWWAELD